MALTWVQDARGNTGTSTAITFIATNKYDNLVVGLTETNAMGTVYKLKFTLRIHLGDATGPVIANLKQARNNYSTGTNNDEDLRAFFDIKDIVNSYLDYTYYNSNPLNGNYMANKLTPIHHLGTDTYAGQPFGTNNNIVRKITLVGGYEYASTPTEPPNIQPYTIFDEKYYVNACINLNPITSSFGATYLTDSNTRLNFHDSQSATKNMLTDYRLDYYQQSTLNPYNLLPNVQFVNEGDYHTVSFLNYRNADIDSYSNDSYSDRLEFNFYNINGNQTGVTQYLDNTVANGGCEPASAVNDYERLIHAGVGPMNLALQTENSTLSGYVSGFVCYTVQLIDGGTNEGSGIYYFLNQKYALNQEYCNKFSTQGGTTASPDNTSLRYVRLAWINSKGAWDYFNFTEHRREKIVSKRKYQKKIQGMWEKRFNVPTKHKDIKTVITQETTRKVTISTGFVTTSVSRYLEWLIKSPLIQIVPYWDAGSNPTRVRNHCETVSITNMQKEHKDVLSDNPLVQFTMDIEFAFSDDSLTR